jgi:hypothetical protein
MLNLFCCAETGSIRRPAATSARNNIGTYLCIMYTRQEASLIRKKFWTSFGQYMRPLPGAGGEPINWLNYKTGIRHLYFRMDADNTKAAVAIELKHPDPIIQQQYFEQLQQVRSILEATTNERWSWKANQTDEDGNVVSRISIDLPGVNIFNENDWPAIISFLKPRMLALDQFWEQVKNMFE